MIEDLQQARRRRFILWGGCLQLLGILAFCPFLRAQVDTGAVVGTVVDPTKAVMPQAVVTLVEERTNVKQTTATGRNGEYTFSPVRLGIYSVSVEKPGYKTTTQQHIEVTIQSRLEVNFTLEIGAVSEKVEVTSTAPILENQTSSLQQLVEAKTINDLPLNGRDAVYLAQLAPGVTFSQSDTRGLQATGSYAANGQDRAENDYLLDGMDNNAQIPDLRNGAQYVIMPPPDALSEFTVQTSNYSAAFGHSAGAVLNVTTKSGTNAFHGDAYEYARNSTFDAKNYFTLPGVAIAPLSQNEFGGTFGGPVVIPHIYNGRNRTFFFVDYQGERINQGATSTNTVPTVAEVASNYSNFQDLLTTSTETDQLGRTFLVGTIFDPATSRAVTSGKVDPTTGLTGKSTGYVRDPFYNGSLSGMTNFTAPAATALMNLLPSARLDPLAITLLQLLPAPNQAGFKANYVSNPYDTVQNDSFDVRFDQSFSPKDTAFARYSFIRSEEAYPGPFAGIADGAASTPGTGHTESQNMALSETHILSARVVNEARVGYSRVYDKRFQYGAQTYGIPQQYGIPGIPQTSENGGLPGFNIGNISFGSAGTLPSDKASDTLQVSDNVTIDRGSNQLRMGFEYLNIAYPTLTPVASRGTFTYGGIYTSIVSSVDAETAPAQFLLLPQATTIPNNGTAYNNIGGANTLAASNFPSISDIGRSYYGGYVQDDWRVLPNLTVNLGLRYEYIGLPNESNGRSANLVPAVAASDGVARYYIPASQASSVPANFIALLAQDGIAFTPVSSNVLSKQNKNDFAPRIGFALQTTSRMVLRGGFGVFYQGSESHGLSTSEEANFPFAVSSTYSDANAVTPLSPTNAIGTLSSGLLNVPLSASSASISAINLEGESFQAATTYVMDYNLQAQFQISPKTIIEVGFVGAGGRHLATSPSPNGVYQIAPATATRASVSFYPQFGTGGTFIERTAASSYNGLQVNVEHRYNKGFSFLANYTYSACLGDYHDLLDNNIGSYRAPFLPGIGIAADWAFCDIQTRSIIHGSGTYELPFGRDKPLLTHGVGAILAGGWVVNGILAVQSGRPTTTIPCSTTNAVAGLSCNALKTGISPYSGSHNLTQWLNPAAYANPAPATATYLSPSVLGGPPTQAIGPASRRFDFSVMRHFYISRERYFEFRAEAFNLTNTPNFSQPNVSNFSNAATFGQITSTKDIPRQIQLALKFYF